METYIKEATPSSRPVRATLLLVDDKPQNLVALRAILEGPEYRLLEATSGEDALRIALREDVTVVLLDVFMPEMDGFEVATHLKQLERTRNIPILFLTADATRSAHVYHAYDVGAVDYLIKPLDPIVVQRKVRVFADLVLQREQIARQAESVRDAERREHEIKIAELRLASDRRYRKLVDGIDHAIGWSANEQLKLTFVSRQAPRILGYSLEEFSAPEFWTRLLHPEDREDVLGVFRRAVAENREFVIDHRAVTSSNEVVWFHTAVAGERVGDTSELHGISVDISEIKKAQTEAEAATKSREQLLAIVSHDLRGPLSAIVSSGELLRRIADSTGENSARIEKFANAILNSAERMRRLVADLLDFAQLQAGALALTRTAVSAGKLLEVTVEGLGPAADAKGLSLTFLPAPGIVVDCDRDRILQVLANLVTNAIRFTPAGGTITLRVARFDGLARFDVADTGEGIARADLPEIWKRYWHSTKAKEGGVGLGLFISRSLIEAHEGQIWVDSHPGVGTTFSFTLSLSENGATSISVVGRATSDEKSGAPCDSITLVRDHEDDGAAG